MLGSRPQLMHNANLAFATSELLFNNLPVLPLHFIFGAGLGQPGAPEASPSAESRLRLPLASAGLGQPRPISRVVRAGTHATPAASPPHGHVLLSCWWVRRS